MRTALGLCVLARSFALTRGTAYRKLTAQRLRGAAPAVLDKRPARLLSRLREAVDFFRSSWDSAKVSFAIFS